jgi:hypothetical protein
MSAIVQATPGTERAERMERAPSTTPVLLRRLRGALIVLALLAGGTALLLTNKAHAVISSAGEHTATAVMQAYAAHEALADADSQAIQTIQTIPLGAWPPVQYQDDIAAAEQSLEQVAENNPAGASGSDPLQLIEGQLTSYTGLMEQADAHYRLPGESGFTVADLWFASELMHGQILTVTQAVQFAEQSALTAQRSSPWVNPWLFAGWLIPALALLGTLVAAQRQFSKRLRRQLSKYLTMAAAALIGLCLVTGHVMAAELAFDSAQSGPLQTALALQDARTAATDRTGQSQLSELVGAACPQCSTTQKQVEAQVKSDTFLPAAVQAEVSRTQCQQSNILECVAQQQRTYKADAVAAEAGYVRSLVLIVALTALLVGLTFLGFRRHLDEYRYRSA